MKCYIYLENYQFTTFLKMYISVRLYNVKMYIFVRLHNVKMYISVRLYNVKAIESTSQNSAIQYTTDITLD